MKTNDSQFELFEGFVATAQRAPKLELPSAAREEVDPKRVARILGCSVITVRRLIQTGHIRGYIVGRNMRIIYESVVEFCEELRRPIAWGLPQRPARKPGMRLRDDAILPFPLADTVYVKDVMTVLRCSDMTVHGLHESGELLAYRLGGDTKRTSWRIYRPSLERYVESRHRMAAVKTPTSFASASR